MVFHTASTKEQKKATTRAAPYTNGSNPTHAHTSTSGILPMPDRPLVGSHCGRPGEAQGRGVYLPFFGGSAALDFFVPRT